MNDAAPRTDPSTEPPAEPALGPLVARSTLGGALMGLANLVPGISGGTMLLAAGVYPRFIAAIGEVTTLRFRKTSVILLSTVVGAAIVAIVLFAGPIKTLVVEQRWVMYALFIGLTLGGVPVVWRLIRANDRKPTASVWVAAAVGFAAMAALALVQSAGSGGAGNNTGFAFMLLAGVAGAAAMILPGVSGGYLLLVLGVYVPILAGISAFKDALQGLDTAALMDVGLAVILPVGLGVVLGIAVVSNLLRWLLKRCEAATLGFLLGLLLGAIVGLWPFQQPIEPYNGLIVKGQPVVRDLAGVWVLETSLEAVELEDLPTETFTPSVIQALGAAGLILLGFAVTMGVDRLGREKPRG